MDAAAQPWPNAVVQAEADWRDRGAASAANYARTAVPAIFGPWAARVLDRLAPAPGTRLLDLACGTGAVARLAAERVGSRGQVVGLDISAGMLTVARSQPPPTGAPLAWLVGTATSLPLGAAAFETAVCAFGLMFIPDRAAALAELHRVLVPGGRLVVAVWGAPVDNPVDARLIDVLSRYAEAGASARQAVAHTLGEPDQLKELLAVAGFQAVEVDSCADEHRTMLTGLLNRVLTPRMDEATRAAVQREVLAALASYIEGDRVRYPVTANLAVGHA